MHTNAPLRTARPPRIVRWRGGRYDFVALLNATPLPLMERAASMSWNAQAWWDCVVDLAPREAEAIARSVTI